MNQTIYIHYKITHVILLMLYNTTHCAKASFTAARTFPVLLVYVYIVRYSVLISRNLMPSFDQNSMQDQ